VGLHELTRGEERLNPELSLHANSVFPSASTRDG
jgi:hypothetical protein